MVMSRLSEVEVFLAVVQTGSISAAARQLGLSKSSVSKSVQALEDRLAVRLLHRTTRALSLTAEGQAFQERAAAALDELLDAENAVSSSRREVSGTLRVSLPLGFGLRFLRQPIVEFMRAHPDLVVHAGFTDRKVDIVEEGYDLAVRGGILKSSSLVARRLCPIRVVIVASPGWVAANGAPTHPRDLERAPMMVYRQNESPGLMPLRAPDGEVYELKVDGPLVSDNGDMLTEAAIAGLGIALQPDFAVAEALADGRLVQLLPGWEGPEAAMWVVYPHRKHLSGRVRAFTDHLLTAFHEVPWQAP